MQFSRCAVCAYLASGAKMSEKRVKECIKRGIKKIILPESNLKTLSNYKDKVDSIKVATRMHALPAMVIDAYARGSYHGNLADLFEPGHGPLFAPYVIDNDKFPPDWFTKTTKCNKYCHECNYCNEICEKDFVNSEK